MEAHDWFNGEKVPSSFSTTRYKLTFSPSRVRDARSNHCLVEWSEDRKSREEAKQSDGSSAHPGASCWSCPAPSSCPRWGETVNNPKPAAILRWTLPHWSCRTARQAVSRTGQSSSTGGTCSMQSGWTHTRSASFISVIQHFVFFAINIYFFAVYGSHIIVICM